MSRINTNISSLQAMHRLNQNQADLATRLQRLSSGLKINSGKDAPAGLIASENLRSEMTGINQAIDNSQRAGNVINTAEGALNEVSSLLLEMQGLTNQAANSGAMSPDEIQANQLQVDSILTSINRVSNTTQFNGVKLLDGSLDFTTSNIKASCIDSARIYSSRLPDTGAVNVTVQVTGSAKLAEIGFAASGISTSPTTIEIAGNKGVEQLSFAASQHNSAIMVAINQLKASTGVSAVMSGGALRMTSTDFGAAQFVSVKTIAGTFTTTSAKTFGTDAQVAINGQAAQVRGTDVSLSNGDIDVSLKLNSTFAQGLNNTSFQITGGGARFQLGPVVNRQGQTTLGIGSIAATKLGDEVIGYLSTLGSGGANSLTSANTSTSQNIISASIRQVATLRGRLGAFQKDVLATNVNSLNVALENVTASESAIRDADFASETAAMTRAQVLVQANTSILAQANAMPQNVLSLLK